MMMKNTSLLILLFVTLTRNGISAHPRKLMGKMMGHRANKGPKAVKESMEKDGKKGKQQLDFSAEDVEDFCTLLEVFDNMGRFENNDKSIPGFEWPDLCDDFRPFNDWLCPSETIVQTGICNHPRPYLNPAIRLHYCASLLKSLPAGPRRESCETWCTNYVSQDRGNCCDLEC